MNQKNYYKLKMLQKNIFMHEKFYPQLLVRFFSIRKDIKIAFFVCLFCILLIEIWLKQYSAYSEILYVLGDIFLKICYSIIAATCFFFINQHIPREKRKIGVNHYVDNKLRHFYEEFDYLLENLKFPTSFLPENISDNDIRENCKSILTSSQVINKKESDLEFDNWHLYLDYKYSKLQKMIDEVLIINEALDTDLLEELLNIRDYVSQAIYYNTKPHFRHTNLDLQSMFISGIHRHHIRVQIIRHSKKYVRYLRESNMIWASRINDKLKRSEAFT